MDNQPQLIDNINKTLYESFTKSLGKNCKVSIVAASFSIYAFEALKQELEKIKELRFVFSSPTFDQGIQKKN